MAEDLASQLRRQIASATGEKEAAKIELESLRRTVDGHLLRLNSILSDPNVGHERLTAAIRALDVDLCSRLDVDLATSASAKGGAAQSGGPGDGTYDVLRHSLNDVQKRCQELNSEMLRVADANEELHGTLRSLKGTNKRLIEEVQKQTEEVSCLTQQRLVDMENLCMLEETFRKEEQVWAAEAQRSVEEEQRRCDEEFAAMKVRLTSQLQECRRKARAVGAKSGSTRTMQGQLKGEVQSMVRGAQANMKQLEREMVDRVAAITKEIQDEETRLKDQQHNLQVKLKTEKEVRVGEVEAWQSRHKALAGELDELVMRRDKEVSELQTKVDAAGAAREAEAKAADTERKALYEKLEGLVRDVSLLDSQTATVRRNCLQLEARLAQVEGERERLQGLSSTLREQIQESDDALTEAVRSNEALREQMEDQRLAAQSQSDKDLKLCREKYEKRLEVQVEGHQKEQADLAKRVRDMEEGISLKAGEVQAARESLMERTRFRDTLQRDVLLWKSQHELAARMLTDVTKEFEHFKQESLDQDLRRKQEEHDELAGRTSNLEIRHAAVADEVRQLERAVRAREVADAEQARAIADLRREAAAEVQRTKASLLDAETALSAAKGEVAAMTQSMGERRDGLEQELSRLTAEAEAEQRELEHRIQAERTSCLSLRDSFDRLRSEHRSSYKQAFELPVQQISALEGTISEIQRSADAELGSLRQQHEQLQKRAEDLEAEHGRLQAQLAQSEKEVQDAVARASLAKANNRSAREALDRERETKASQLQQVQRSILQKQEQLHSAVAGAEDTRKKMLQEIEDLRAAKARQVMDTDYRMPALRADHSPDRSGTFGHSRDIGLSREHLEGLAQENDQLRRYVSENRFTSGHVHELGSQMQRSLASMEDRAMDLRRGLHR